MNRLGFQSRGLGHPLCRAACGRCQKNFEPVRPVGGDNAMGGGGLAGSRPSGHHHDLCGRRPPDRIRLYFIIDHPGFFLYGFHIHGKIRISRLFSGLKELLAELISRRRRSQLLKLSRHARLRIIKGRQVNCRYGIALLVRHLDLPLPDQLFLPEHLIHGHDNRFRRGFQKL